MVFDDQIVEFVRIRAAAGPGDAFATVDGAALGVAFNKSVVARLLHPAGDLIQRVVPGDVLPVSGSRAANLRFQQAAFIEDVLLERRALGTESPAIDGMVGIALDVDHLRSDVLGLVAKRVDDDSAAYRAVGTRRTGFRSTRDF